MAAGQFKIECYNYIQQTAEGLVIANIMYDNLEFRLDGKK